MLQPVRFLQIFQLKVNGNSNNLIFYLDKENFRIEMNSLLDKGDVDTVSTSAVDALPLFRAALIESEISQLSGKVTTSSPKGYFDVGIT